MSRFKSTETATSAADKDFSSRNANTDTALPSGNKFITIPLSRPASASQEEQQQQRHDSHGLRPPSYHSIAPPPPYCATYDLETLEQNELPEELTNARPPTSPRPTRQRRNGEGWSARNAENRRTSTNECGEGPSASSASTGAQPRERERRDENRTGKSGEIKRGGRRVVGYDDSRFSDDIQMTRFRHMRRINPSPTVRWGQMYGETVLGDPSSSRARRTMRSTSLPNSFRRQYGNYRRDSGTEYQDYNTSAFTDMTDGDIQTSHSDLEIGQGGEELDIEDVNVGPVGIVDRAFVFLIVQLAFCLCGAAAILFVIIWFGVVNGVLKH
jgi:hypothetical protein